MTAVTTKGAPRPSTRFGRKVSGACPGWRHLLRAGIILLVVGLFFAPAAQSAPPVPTAKFAGLGLHVTKDGVLEKDGKPFRRIGVNFVSAFLWLREDPNTPSVEQAFRVLSQHHIPFCRFVGSGWTKADMQLYLTDREEYFRRMGMTVALAEKYNVGLIFSMFWSGWVKDVTGERELTAWLDPASKTHQMMAEYVREVLTRFGKSPAIWGWEWGNELNLACDLPNAAEFGTRPQDQYTHKTMRLVHAAFAREVRKYDDWRIVISGNTMPRESAWNQIRDGKWTPDTWSQFASVLKDDNPAPLDVMTVHAYKNDFASTRLGTAASAARQMKKPLFVEEFGVSGPRTPAQEREFRQQIALIEKYKIPLAALWEFDVRPIYRPEWLISPDNDRFYMLLEIEKSNAKRGL